MAGQGPKNTYIATKVPGQAQMVREPDGFLNQSSDAHSQGQAANFLQETETQVMNMAQDAADVGKGATQNAVNLARGAALGATNMAQRATDVIKNTLGMTNSSHKINTVGGTTTKRNMTINFAGANSTNKDD